MPTQEQAELAQARSRIRRLEAQMEAVYKHLRLSFTDDSGDDDPKVIAAIKANNIIEAIKLYRAATNANLEEARLAIDEMRGRLGI